MIKKLYIKSIYKSKLYNYKAREEGFYFTFLENIMCDFNKRDYEPLRYYEVRYEIQ